MLFENLLQLVAEARGLAHGQRHVPQRLVEDHPELVSFELLRAIVNHQLPELLAWWRILR